MATTKTTAKKATTKKTAEKKPVEKKTATKTAAKTTAKKTATKPVKTEVVVKKTVKAKAEKVVELKDLKKAVEQAAAPAEKKAEEAPVKREPKKDKFGRAFAAGKRKDAIARVWLKLGKGKITVNGQDVNTYFARPVLQMIINQPFVATSRVGQYDVECTVRGGGLSGQAGALRHGISRCLDAFEPDLHSVLRKGGFLTRDSRAVERKKYGKAKARRSYQFSKR